MTTEKDRSASYYSDPLVRAIEDAVRAEPMQRRLYPDLYSERIAEAVRSVLATDPPGRKTPGRSW